MASSKLNPLRVLLAVIVLVALALLVNAYSELVLTQQLNLTYVIKVILAVLAVGFLVFFQLRWVATKYDLSVLHFYIKWKFFKQSLPAGAGILFLASAFLLDFAQYVHWVQGESVQLAINLLEILALVFVGYTYYRLARLQGI
ncbi:Uncharacterised protein [Candidatus Burarchaeum australiense]|nr:Uncharacterised protein [Candidatus Burarchaeum australiense]